MCVSKPVRLKDVISDSVMVTDFSIDEWTNTETGIAVVCVEHNSGGSSICFEIPLFSIYVFLETPA